MKKETKKTDKKIEKSDREKRMLEALYTWYPSAARDLPWRRDVDPYHVWISEIMLQQTRVEAVKGYYKRFLDALPTIKDLACVEDDVLMKLWEGLGYYNRARNLKKAATVIVEQYGGVFPNTYEEIHSLPGIGTYTAGAIGSTCFELETPAVDGNVLRVYARVMAYYENIDKQSTKDAVRAKLQGAYESGRCRLATQSLMELGATVCVPNGTPHCKQCPLADMCKSKEDMLWSKLPVRAEKKTRKCIDMTVFIMRCGDKFAIAKRPKKGLLSGLFEYPNIEGAMTEQQAMEYATSLQVSPDRLHMTTTYTHIFSHVEWHMIGVYFDCFQMPEQYIWATEEELIKKYALPSAFRPFFEASLKLNDD